MITARNRIGTVRSLFASTLLCALFTCAAPPMCRADGGGGAGGAGNPGVPAIGTAAVTYDISTYDWAVTNQDYSDHGDNYAAVGPGYIMAAVSSSQAGASMTSYEHVITTFSYIGYGTPDSCSYTSTGDVTAYIGETG